MTGPEVHHDRRPVAVQPAQGEPQRPVAVGHQELPQVVVHAVEQLVGRLAGHRIAGRDQRGGHLAGRGGHAVRGVGEQVDVLGGALDQAVDQPGDAAAEHEAVFAGDGQGDPGDVAKEGGRRSLRQDAVPGLPGGAHAAGEVEVGPDSDQGRAVQVRAGARRCGRPRGARSRTSTSRVSVWSRSKVRCGFHQRRRGSSTRPALGPVSSCRVPATSTGRCGRARWTDGSGHAARG